MDESWRWWRRRPPWADPLGKPPGMNTRDLLLRSEVGCYAPPFSTKETFLEGHLEMEIVPPGSQSQPGALLVKSEMFEVFVKSAVSYFAPHTINCGMT